MQTALIRLAPRLSALLLAVLMACGAAQVAASAEDVQALLRQGQLLPALDRADRELATNPKDRRLRFLKGVILAELNRLDEAATIFVKLTEEAPELPEPYNNLAVIYAQQRQYDKARAALEMAIRTHPSYSVAHENMGDLYAKMARQAYDRALQLDASNPATQAKLALIREIISVGTKPPGPAPTVAAKPASPAPAPSAASIAAAAPPAAARPAAPPAASAPTPVAAAKPAATASAPSADSRNAKAAEDEVERTVLAWANAWSRKDVKAYLGYYARDFDVPGRTSRAAWEEERRTRVGKPGSIKVTLSNIRTTVKGDQATVRFRQGYASTGLNSSSNKTLELVRRDGRWLIQQERIGN